MSTAAASERPPVANYIYKIMPRAMYTEAKAAADAKQEDFVGSSLDQQDGFIHFSQSHQVAGTLGRFYKGQTDLVVLKVSVAALDADEAMVKSNALRYEFGVPRPEGADHNQMYPHLFAKLPMSAVVEVITVVENAAEEGTHVAPVLEA